VVERFIAPVLKTGDVKASGGSNPSSSAKSPDKSRGFFVFNPVSKMAYFTYILKSEKTGLITMAVPRIFKLD
jgi:hypothetical protein